MSSKIIQIIPATPNMWAIWMPTKYGEETEYSPIVCLALMEDEDGGTYVTPMAATLDGEIDNPMDVANFGGIVFSEDPAVEGKPLWHDAKTDPPKTAGLYYGKKDNTDSMWLCFYDGRTWVLANSSDVMDIVKWAEHTAFSEAHDGA